MDSLQILRHGFPATLLLETHPASGIPTILKHTCTTGAVYEHRGNRQHLLNAPAPAGAESKRVPALLLVPPGEDDPPSPGADSEWALTIELAPTGTHGAMSVDDLALLVMEHDAAYVFWRPAGRAAECPEITLSCALKQMVQRGDLHVARRIAHRLARNPWARLHGPGIERAVRLLLQAFPTDTVIATLIVQHYGIDAPIHPAGALALYTLRTHGNQDDVLFYEAHDLTRSLSIPHVKTVVRDFPGKYLGLIMERCSRKHRADKVVVFAEHLLSLIPATLHTVRLHHQATAAAFSLGKFTRALTHAKAALAQCLVLHPHSPKVIEPVLSTAFEAALYCATSIPAAIRLLELPDHPVLSAYLRELPECQYLTQDDEAALKAAEGLAPEQQSLQRVMFLAQCERRLGDLGWWDRELQRRLQLANLDDRAWFHPEAPASAELFRDPRERTFLSQAIALQRAAHLLETEQYELFRMHLVQAAVHLHGWSQLGAILTGGFRKENANLFEVWFNPTAVLRLNLFGTPKAMLDGHDVQLSVGEFELIAFLAHYPEGASGQQLKNALYRNNIAESVVRTRVLGLGNLVVEQHGRYRLKFACVTDYHHFAHARTFGALATMKQLYTGPLFPSSRAPYFVALRREAEQALATLEQQHPAPHPPFTWPGPRVPPKAG